MKRYLSIIVLVMTCLAVTGCYDNVRNRYLHETKARFNDRQDAVLFIENLDDIDLAIAYTGAASLKGVQALKTMLGIVPAEAKRDQDGAIIGLAAGIKRL